MDAFIESFFLARESVMKLKHDFGDALSLHVVLKNITNDGEEIFFGVADVDSYVKTRYNRDDLERMLI